MEPHRFRPRLIEVAVVVAGILVAIYAGWVIRDVTTSGPDVSPGANTRAITESPNPTMSASAAPASIEPFRRAVTRASSVLLIGDASGDQLGEWVDLWSGGLAENVSRPRQVSLHTWDILSQEFVTATVGGTGPLLDVWNLSYPGAEADYAQHLDQLPEAPDAVFYSLGQDRTPRAVRRAVTTTTAAVTERWGQLPTVYVLQHPTTGPGADRQEAAVEEMRELAMAGDVPVIDVGVAFRRAGNLENLLIDGGLPSAEGSRVWARAVTRALSP